MALIVQRTNSILCEVIGISGDDDWDTDDNEEEWEDDEEGDIDEDSED